MREHLEGILGCDLLVDELSHLYGAYGAALLHLERAELERLPAGSLESLMEDEETVREYFYEPLAEVSSSYPDFADHEAFTEVSSILGVDNPVEVDLYADLETKSVYRVYLGIDIGSTSTKAVLENGERGVLCGFYTRTVGKPLLAVRGIFEVIERIAIRFGCTFDVIGSATTGSGRKFVGKIIGAGLILDEITAHARAAYELDPRVDTIIEIGGQDSKFTTVRDGTVTFSQMNTVCAAGTGSFIEEQAGKLGVPLSEISDRARGVRVPLASDRCTVFMERDINRYLNRGYSIDEILAAVLLAVRENYLLKVATEGSIGERICFQGATAKNASLVSAFEARLGRPISVSRYCHLTGAYGAALVIREEVENPGRFRGLDLWREEIPVASEICEMCTNHCRIRVATVQGEKVAYGFLCGRDYDTDRFVDSNTSGFDLLRFRRKAERAAFGASRQDGAVRIGIPASLHILEDLPFWVSFFSDLGYRPVTSLGAPETVRTGKRLAGAEFCAPMASFHGHVRALAGKCDLLFLPTYIDGREEAGREDDARRSRQYCYYTQFAPSLVAKIEEGTGGAPPVMPLISRFGGRAKTIRELHRSLRESEASQKGVSRGSSSPVSLGDIEQAYKLAEERTADFRNRLRYGFETAYDPDGDISVCLVGRPYAVLDAEMNKGIPGIFGSLGVKAFFQDMVPAGDGDIGPLLDAVHWGYAARILESAAYAAATAGLYPVFVTSFKCTPDSFIIEYFKRILDAKRKPYLILQLDEHGSNVGYETRIEAGIRAFRNHRVREREGAEMEVSERPLPYLPRISSDYQGKTILFPNWDPISMPFIVANLRRAGIDVRLLEENPTIIRKSMRMNTGQCIPLNVIVEEAIEYVGNHGLDPAKTALWMIGSRWSCGLGMYPYYMKTLLEGRGEGMEKMEIYLGDVTHIEISPLLTIRAYFAYLFGGFLRRLGCRYRPYEVEPGAVDAAMEASHRAYLSAFNGECSFEEATDRTVGLIEAVPITGERKPKVAIFGDLYVRDNDVMNQDLVRDIERAGGEVITTPYNEYVKIVSGAAFRRMIVQRRFLDVVTFKTILSTMEFLEKKYERYFGRFLDFPLRWREPDADSILSSFNVRLEHQGESYDNLLKIFHIIREHPDISLFVQTNPAFCCPSLVTEAMSDEIERLTGVPIVTVTYDGTGDPKNDVIVPYLAYPREKNVGEAHRRTG